MGKVATESTLESIRTSMGGVVQDTTQQRVASALEELNKSLATTAKIIIMASSTDGSAVPDQVVKIYNATSGALFTTVVVNSEGSTTVEVIAGNNYRIVPQNTISGYYISSKPTVSVIQSVTVQLTWKPLGTVETFADIKYLIDEGMGQYITLGNTVVKAHHATLGDIYFECVDWDEDAGAMTLLCGSADKFSAAIDTLRDQLQFDAPEALLKAADGLSAGAYTFKNGSTTYYFTLSKAIPAGGQLCLNSGFTEFYVYNSAKSVEASETGAVSTAAIAGAIDLGTCAVGNLNHGDRVKYGSNDYGESNLRQWLEADGAAGEWWEPQTQFDRPSTYAIGGNAIAGFLAGFSPEDLDALDVTEVKCVAQNTYCAPDSTHTKNTRYTVDAKFFLASQKEIFGTADFNDGSTQFDLYVGSVDADRIKRYNGSARSWWLRSPFPNAYCERCVYASGAVSFSYANYTLGVVPACKISKSS